MFVACPDLNVFVDSERGDGDIRVGRLGLEPVLKDGPNTAAREGP